VRQCKKTADPQMAHLVFTYTHPKAEKPKEPFLSNAPTESYKKTYEVFLQEK